ncbi:Flp family type IVb pilin [Candidatus Liberibacter sp.]|uniref:Flp family type IVb pilin n=1 Tax=Candidatus Liberibacter sp. TaxID=34022 RepID=UPI0015F6BBE7|nr:Flp family type IVb pilin [Candidatus Liberibacter sp.]MBA5723927.1 Flp family type IVb pilin [Candidatus Liberibacter sp.]
MLFLVKCFLKDESGATAIEYGLIASLIAVAMIAATSSLGNAISNKFAYITNKLSAAGS